MNKPKRNLERLRKIVVKKSFGRREDKKGSSLYKWLKRFREDPEGEWWKIDPPDLKLYT